MTTKTPSQKYRATKKKNGFLCRCFWIHKDDLSDINWYVEKTNLERRSAMLQSEAKKEENQP